MLVRKVIVGKVVGMMKMAKVLMMRVMVKVVVVVAKWRR